MPLDGKAANQPTAALLVVGSAFRERNQGSDRESHPAARVPAGHSEEPAILDRRTIIKGAAAGLGGAMAGSAGAQMARPPGGRFSFADVVSRATQLASVPFEGQLPPLPDELGRLNFDAWRQIEFRSSKPLLGSQFHLELFHLGHLYKRPVVVNTIRDGIPTPIPYQSSEFNYGTTKFTKPLPVNLGFAGLKILTPLNSPKVFDEFITFVGASYFRFLGRGQTYGLSARGLALAGGTNEEEFPFFREFWIDAPKAEATSVTIYALLDSSVVTGAYQFDCSPAENSTVEVAVTLIPRRAGVKVGMAPLTSMFDLGESQDRLRSEFRPELHDSDGLLVHTGSGEWLWRPLRNPPDVAKTSTFLDRDVQGFGLLQRDRVFTHYEDIDLAYQLRPSYWVTPSSKFGEGHVELFEMPTTDETNDNVVASWVPAADPQPGKALSYGYSITSALDFDHLAANGKVSATFQTSARALGSNEPDLPNVRRFIVDFAGGDLPYYRDDPSPLSVVASTSLGRVLHAYTQFNPYTNGVRAMIDVEVPSGQTTNLRAFLKAGPTTLTETWTYPWEAPATPQAAAQGPGAQASAPPPPSASPGGSSPGATQGPAPPAPSR